MGGSILRLMFFLNIVIVHLTTAAPLANDDEADYYYDCGSETAPSISRNSGTSSASSSAPVLSTRLPDTSSYTFSATSRLTSLSSSAIQVASSTVEPQTLGTIISSLETSGKSSVQPFPTSVASASTTLSLINTASTRLPQPNAVATASTMSVNNVFVAFASGPPPSQVSQRSDHPVARSVIAPQTKKLQTNKFYANFFLGSRSSSTFTHPYSVAWAKGSGILKSYGLAISHIERSQLAFGPGNPARYFINPIGIQSITLSASELGSTTQLTMDSLDAFSANVNLLPRAGAAPAITFPLVQGMGFITGVYSKSTPRVESSISFITITYIGRVASGSTYKYRAKLADSTTWNIYVTTSQVEYPVNAFTLSNVRVLQGAAGFQGFIQVAKVPNADAEKVYDEAAGAYPIAAKISGAVSGTAGTYNLAWTKQGVANRTLLMFALPHHVQSLTYGAVTGVKLQTTTKGMATGIIGNSWTLVEPKLPNDMGFAPWSPSRGSVNKVSAAAARLINKAGESELSQDMKKQSNLNSMYYSGKALAKFAAIAYAVHDIGNNATLAVSGLQKLKLAFDTFVRNKQVLPLVYESSWGGAVSSGTYQTGDSGLDFGNTYYNDHHFHYGYFVYAAAVIGYLDPSWLTQGTNKAWVNMLVRDYSNSVTNDAYFPFSRSFDWYHGHSWAKGLFESGDGKDEESSSEDTLSTYAIKMWGRTIGDKALEARGNLMLAVQARSMLNYFLYTSDNTVQPANFIANKVSGVLFDNKIDYTTYFGSNPEFIHGIHMIPAGFPFSAYIRTQKFVTEEWNAFFSNGRANVDGGWRGILYGNLATIQPAASYAFFSDPKFNPAYLDGGASLTWYLTYSAALGGSPAAAKRSEVEDVVLEGEPEIEEERAHRAVHRRRSHGHAKL
ncbi:endo-1,3-beta-glucanase [Aureobasidium subglaciale]|nr:endo-1,3-beta-glucanase [Aureobasidium subglaciale]KAI5222583.1 endo-1,3-beta-glucanase [Aureobasidium subglaciale]KAI5233109.1 endo-1,3-beta-glucanase [Aureobasidium subglaciale]KAI5262226.1 endo-1,3-beta-glucanase [Aureobasidium subglaciale]